MKKRKFSIILNISALCLCLAAIAIGVYSVKTAQLNITGTIGFQAHNCNVYVSGIITGAATKNSDDTLTPTTLYYNKDNTEAKKDTCKSIHDDKDGWEIGDLYFDDLNDVPDDKIAKDIVMTLRICNKSKFPVFAIFNGDELGIDTSKITITSSQSIMLIPEDSSSSTYLGNVDYMATLTITFTLESEDFNKLTLTSEKPLVKFTNVKPADMPIQKGDLITMDLGGDYTTGLQNTYRVLKTDGNTALVMAMFEASTCPIWGQDTSYANSALDTYLNTTWYETLNDAAKSAIVESNITQYSYAISNDVYDDIAYASEADYSTKAAEGSAIKRKVYALDVEDIVEYFGGTAGSADKNTARNFSQSDMQILFMNTTFVSMFPWLRSVSITDDFVYAWLFYGNLCNLRAEPIGMDYSSYSARPAFKIDLSKISYNLA